MAESPSWKQRLQEARQRAVFEPTPTGAKPHVVTVERLAETLDAVDVAAAASSPDSAADTMARAISMILRELINARLYERNLHANFETQPDRIDTLLERVTQLLDAAGAPGAKRG